MCIMTKALWKQDMSNVLQNKVGKIVEEHLIGGKPVEEYVIPAEDEAFLSQQQRIVLRNCGQINPEKIDEYIDGRRL